MQALLRWLSDALGQTFWSGVATAVMTLLAPVWALLAGAPGYITLTVLLASLAAALVIIEKLRRLLNDTWRTAFLRLQIYGDERVPIRIGGENVFRWFHLRNLFRAPLPNGEMISGESGTLFVTFDRDVRISTLEVHSPDAQLPQHEVKEYNQRYAIISFSGPLPRGTLEVKAGT